MDAAGRPAARTDLSTLTLDGPPPIGLDTGLRARPGAPTTDVFPGTSAMAELMRATDWSATRLGPADGWPASLRTAVAICLESRFPIVIFWGPDLVLLYNDAYLPALGDKHPTSLAQPCRECWSEIWPTIGPMLAGVMERGEATWSDDLLLGLNRRGFIEEDYFTFSYGPIRDLDGRVDGVFCAVTETTARVRGERRLALLRALRATPRQDLRAVADSAISTIASAARDVTFAAIALHDDDGRLGRPILGSGRPDRRSSRLLQEAAGRIAARGEAEWIELPANGGVDVLLQPMPDGATGWSDVLALGRNPQIALDDDYLSFFGLVATHVATELATARSYQAERRRADALAELDRAKTLFFTNVSHEFRTPLTLLEGPLREVADDPLLGTANAERIEMARRAAARLHRLVNTLLEFSRIEAGTARPNLVPIDLLDAVSDVASVFRSTFERAGLVLEITGDRLPRPVLADPEMLERILLNLISNALKFTARGGVELHVATRAGRAVVEVRDTGVGIAADALSSVFDRFARVESSWARSREGSGIGLALASELARVQNGDLSVSSTLGVGTTFSLELPLDDGAPRRLPRPSRDRRAFAYEASGWVEQRPGVWAVPAEVEASGERARILVVDDNADMGDYLARILGRHWLVERAFDGRSALERILADPPDLVLADVMMPGLDGLELVRRIRREERLATLPVVMLSARAGDEARSEGLGVGADDYLVKPFSATDLVMRVASRLERERARSAEARVLAERERQLRTALQAKDEFLGMVSHELRTPVTTIIGRADLMMARGHLDPDARDAVADIVAEADRLDRVIHNLLLLARIGNDPLEREPVLVRRVIEQVVSSARREAPGREFLVACPRILLTDANHGAVEQILRNLVSNAVKYSPASEPVRIRARREGRRVAISVTDRGLGLARSEVGRIFEPFFRSQRTRHVAGVGIGLTVADRLARAVDGELRAGPARGGGATFTLTLRAIDPDDAEVGTGWDGSRGSGLDGSLDEALGRTA